MEKTRKDLKEKVLKDMKATSFKKFEFRNEGYKGGYNGIIQKLRAM